MQYFACFYLFFQSIFFFYIRRDIFHPAFLINLSFLGVLLLYGMTSNFYIYEVEDETYQFIILMILIFSISSLLADYLARIIYSKRNELNIALIADSPSKPILIAITSIIFSLVYIFFRMQNYNFGDNFLNYMNELREGDVESVLRDSSAYLQPFILISWAYFFYVNRYSSKKVSLLLFSLVVSCFSCALILNTGKQIIFMAILATAYLYDVRKTLHLFFISFSVVLIFSIYMIFIRGLDGSVSYYLSMYIVSPILALQEFYFKAVYPNLGSNILWFYERVMSVLGNTIELQRIHKPFVYVGLATNVFTAFSEYIYYSVVFSGVMMAIHGFLAGFLWRKAKDSIAIKVFFAYFLYTIVFSFYHESFIINISSWIQFIIAITFMFFLSRVSLK